MADKIFTKRRVITAGVALAVVIMASYGWFAYGGVDTSKQKTGAQTVEKTTNPTLDEYYSFINSNDFDGARSYLLAQKKIYTKSNDVNMLADIELKLGELNDYEASADNATKDMKDGNYYAPETE